MEIRLEYDPYGLLIIFLLNRQSKSLMGVRFTACGDSSGESLVVRIARVSRRVATRKVALRVNDGMLVMNPPMQNQVSLRVPDGVSKRELKLLFQGREQYRALRVSAKMSWEKELTFVLP